MEIKKLSLANANALFERIGALLAERDRKVFPVFSQWDHNFKGVTALLAPVEASMIFDVVARTLFALEPTARLQEDACVLSVRRTAAIFTGRVLCTPDDA